MSTLPQREAAATLVVGGAGLIGASIVRRLLRAGHRVGVVDTSEERCALLARETRDAGQDAVVRPGDAADEQSLLPILQQWNDEGTPVTGLVHCAVSSPQHRAFRSLTLPEWDAVINDCLTTSFVSAQAVLRWMFPRGRGRIVLISSALALRVGTSSFHDAAYAASKEGMHGLMRTLSRSLARRNITVNAVAPGLVRSGLTEIDQAPEVFEAIEAAWRHECPLGRLCQPDEVAALVAFLLSEDAGFINGAIIPIDGGYQC